MSDMEEINGGRHSKIGVRYDLIDPRAIKRMAAILHVGAQTHQDVDGSNWRRIPVHAHLNHALAHIYAHFAGESGEDHLGNAFTRLMMAVAVMERE